MRILKPGQNLTEINFKAEDSAAIHFLNTKVMMKKILQLSQDLHENNFDEGNSAAESYFDLG